MSEEKLNPINVTGAPLVGGSYLMYKDRPLVREGDTICYGDMTEKYILVMDIMSYKDEGGTAFRTMCSSAWWKRQIRIKYTGRAARRDCMRRSGTESSGWSKRWQNKEPRKSHAR